MSLRLRGPRERRRPRASFPAEPRRSPAPCTFSARSADAPRGDDASLERHSLRQPSHPLATRCPAPASRRRWRLRRQAGYLCEWAAGELSRWCRRPATNRRSFGVPLHNGSFAGRPADAGASRGPLPRTLFVAAGRVALRGLTLVQTGRTRRYSQGHEATAARDDQTSKDTASESSN